MNCIEFDLLTRMYQGDIDIANRMFAIGDYAMAAESLARAIEKIGHIKSLSERMATQNLTTQIVDIP